MRLKLILAFAGFFTLGINSLFAQSQILDNYIQIALKQNLSIEARQLNHAKQQSRIEQARRLWGPSIDVNTTYLLAEGGRLINFPIGDLFNPAYDALNQITGINQFPTDLANEEIQLTPNNFIDAQLKVSLPLVNSSIRYNQKIQQTLLQLEDLNTELQKEDIEYQVKSAYYNYLKSLEGLRILEESEQLLQEVLTFNRKLVKFDKATDEIIYDVEYQLANLNSQKATVQEQSILAKALFNLLLKRELEEEIEVDVAILEGINLDLETIEALQKTALGKRLEFQQLEVAKEVNALNQERIEKEGKPTIGASGGVGVQTEGFDFDNGGPLFTLGLSMNINLFDNGQRKQKIEELRIDREILQNSQAQLKQKVEIEVVQAYYALQSLQSRMQSEEAAERSAAKSLERFQTRYKNSKALLIELLQAQNRLTSSQLSKALTKYDFLIKQAELEKVVGGISNIY